MLAATIGTFQLDPANDKIVITGTVDTELIVNVSSRCKFKKWAPSGTDYNGRNYTETWSGLRILNIATKTTELFKKVFKKCVSCLATQSASPSAGVFVALTSIVPCNEPSGEK